MQLIDAMLQYAGVEHTSFDMDDIYYMYNANLYIYIYIYIGRVRISSRGQD